jgi:hypothetical protein
MMGLGSTGACCAASGFRHGVLFTLEGRDFERMYTSIMYTM